MAYHADTVVHLNTGQLWTIGHEVVRNGGQLRGNINAGQLLTATERTVFHRRNAVRQRHCGKACIGKGIITYVGQCRLFGNVDCGQIRTVLERIMIDTSCSISQCHTL